MDGERVLTGEEGVVGAGGSAHGVAASGRMCEEQAVEGRISHSYCNSLKAKLVVWIRERAVEVANGQIRNIF